MSKVVDRVSDSFASRSSRRGFLGVVARLTAVIGGSALGLVGLGNDAAAEVVFCCDIVPGRCTTCPNCPTGWSDYYWTCCYNGCKYFCRDCTNQVTGQDCSCYWTDNTNCSGICSFRPARAS